MCDEKFGGGKAEACKSFVKREGDWFVDYYDDMLMTLDELCSIVYGFMNWWKEIERNFISF